MEELVTPLRWERREDVEMRLLETIVRYKDWPCKVRATGGNTGLDVNLVPLGDKRLQPRALLDDYNWIHSSNVDLDVSSAPLGYVNGKRWAYYLCRSPMRRQKQGLHPDNVRFLDDLEGRQRREHSVRDVLYSHGVVDTIQNKYPSAVECLRRMREEVDVSSQAFSRKMCIERDTDVGDLGLLRIKHMGRTIGFILPDQHEVSVPVKAHRNSLWMREYLSKTGLEVRLG